MSWEQVPGKAEMDPNRLQNKAKEAGLVTFPWGFSELPITMSVRSWLVQNPNFKIPCKAINNWTSKVNHLKQIF